MGCERPKRPMLLGCWERRIGCRLDAHLRAVDPVKEINSHLLPNDHPEARLRPVTSHRSLVRPFTPLAGFRLAPTGEV